MKIRSGKAFNKVEKCPLQNNTEEGAGENENAALHSASRAPNTLKRAGARPGKAPSVPEVLTQGQR